MNSLAPQHGAENIRRRRKRGTPKVSERQLRKLTRSGMNRSHERFYSDPVQRSHLGMQRARVHRDRCISGVYCVQRRFGSLAVVDLKPMAVQRVPGTRVPKDAIGSAIWSHRDRMAALYKCAACVSPSRVSHQTSSFLVKFTPRSYGS